MVETLKIREATMYDKDAVLELNSIYEKGYDPLFSQYEEHLLAPYRHCYVAENQHRELVRHYFVANYSPPPPPPSLGPMRTIQVYLGYYVASKLRSLPQAQSKGYHIWTAVIWPCVASR
jgi:hypothetical protein